jgi:spore coat polysaccharide biosynthesis protein SpsF
MEGGLLNKNVCFVIQARIKSTRLPKKILLPLPIVGGQPLLSLITDELKKSKFRNEIFVATSNNEENNVLVSFCVKNNVKCFRGDEENVLSRFTCIAKSGHYDCIVRLTGDNPIIDISLLDDLIKNHFKKGNDYTKTEGLPLGMNFEIISPKTLINIESQELTDSDKEHVTQYIINSNKYIAEIILVKLPEKFRELRLTVDYASDYSLLSNILSISIQQNNLKGVALVEYAYNNYPYLFDINSSNIQKKRFSNINEEIIKACDILDLFELNNASKILRDFKNSNKFIF